MAEMTKLGHIILRSNSRHGLWTIPLLIAISGCAGLTASTADFASWQNSLNLVAQAAPLILVSIGQMIVILVRGLDLSVGAVVSLTTGILSLNAPVYFTLPGAIAMAVVVGLLNGFSVTRLRVHPIIATLSIMGITQGVAMLMRPTAGGTVPSQIVSLVNGHVLGIYMPVLWTIVAVLVAWKIVHGSRLGLHLFAIGGGETAGTFGIAEQRNIIAAYVLSSCFAAVAGIFLAGRIASGDPNIGAQYAIDSITAVALGGTQLAGGIGSVHGTVIGCTLLALIANGMNLLNVSAFVQTVVKGLILLVVISLQPRKNIGL
ncbi:MULTISPECIES: ABC transporter permease [unclassified Bradyrhizobium]|uniref:ABC transporter permease n=2 Tax=Bradyrhizobium TaxID=374 RepID=UPI001FF89B0F|nr:ABC transporter permease [Bradyrhizobium sp. 162]MCK1312377.1 ABC transporter permease [Bradyrhizobium sp. 23]MCK1331782.1 ABC transporter permease [Bradyrhizobium sp. CW9]MCK1505187.1 ABC transporter permease [Bradyrhizobium sp. 18]MCK1695042.1 ABC transporter permease [Bradyrhizobium sp. 144]MCK1629250.1 ABC transporter permease [Bradyrhizobium sp. 162]